MIVLQHEQSIDLTILTGSESIDAGEVVAAMEEMYAGEPTRLVLWDLTGVDVTGVTFADVQTIARLAVEHGRRRPGGKTAIMTAQQVTFGLNRVYESLLDGTAEPLQVHVCWTLEDALEFLGIEELPGR